MIVAVEWSGGDFKPIELGLSNSTRVFARFGIERSTRARKPEVFLTIHAQ